LALRLFFKINMKKTLQVINQLKEKKLIEDYAIGGGIGALFYIEPILTYDLDVFILVSPRFKKGDLILFSPIYDYLKKYPRQREHIIIEGIPVQFIPANGLEAEAIKTAKEIKYRGVKTKVIRAEYLIALFLKSGRRKDKEKVNMLLEQTKIDKRKLKKILENYSLKGKLKVLKP